MATYAAYRHIELDKVGYSKKRVRNPSSEILNVMCTPPSEKQNGHFTPRRSLQHVDSFNRLFGSSEMKKTPPRRASLTNHDVNNRNPVTGNGVTSWDSRPAKCSTPRIHTERNPVTGETYTIVSSPVTPTAQNGSVISNGTSTPMLNGRSTPQINGKTSHFNGKVPQMNGKASQMNGNTPQMNGKITHVNGSA